MDDVLCPICGKPNPGDIEKCEFCGGPLKHDDSHFIQVGEEPEKKDSSDLEKVKPASGEQVHPGEAPIKENPDELEDALPSWLRSLRENKDDQAEESAAGIFPDQSLPLGSISNASPDSLDNLPDRLPNFAKTSTDGENNKAGWMDNLRWGKADLGAPAPESAVEPGLNESNNSSAKKDVTNKPLQPDSEHVVEELQSTLPDEPLFGQEGLPDWLQELQSKTAAEEISSAGSQGKGELPGWLDSLRSESSTNEAGAQPPIFQDEGKNLNKLDSIKAQSTAGGNPVQPIPTSSNTGESVPDWLAGLTGISEQDTPATSPKEIGAPAESLPDWLNQFKGQAINIEPTPAENTNSTDKTGAKPDWLSDLGSISATPESPSEEYLPKWLSNLEDEASPEIRKPAEISDSGQPPSGTTREEIPEWISRFNKDTSADLEQEPKQDQNEKEPESTAEKDNSDSLPDWLAGIQTNTTAPAEGTPALILNGERLNPGDVDAPAFSFETPDWLLKIMPEQNAELFTRSNVEESTLENPEISELPSWVQAMRPVESVVAGAKPATQEGPGVTEQSGPLAGLSGVLPIGPGLGQLSKPPAYSVKLQATEGQQRYAASLERLVSSETQPISVKSNPIVTNRLWRWFISIVLILAVGLPLITHIPISQAPELKPPEMTSAFTIISSLPANAPVLAIFDYDPAYSGELEAAATPLMDQLLLQNPRLTLLSTSPTGSALAQRFMTDTSTSPLIAGHNYQAGQQYVNLGYLAGGPSGIQFFALSPSIAAPFTVDGQSAWQLPPMEGIQKLSDFTAILVLTDNADSGRTWIEQTGSSIGSTPLLMVISAQAEPMLLPYYNSGQIKGLVTGLVGGQAYAQTYLRPDGQTGPGQYYWNAFSAGMLAAEVLILLGAVWNAIAGRRTHRNKTGERA